MENIGSQGGPEQSPARHADKDHVHREQERRPDGAGPHRARLVLEDGTDAVLPGPVVQSLKGSGFKSNYYDVETGDEYWISGPRKDGGDRLYGEPIPVEIDDDVREEYWTQIRRLPGRAGETIANR
jgi:hypothetical protein